MFHCTLKLTVFILSGSAAAFNISPWGGKRVQTISEIKKNFANVLATGVISAATLLPLPGPAVAVDSLVLGTPLEIKLANFGRASYPVFNSITDVSPLADRFVDFVDKKVKAPDAAELAQRAVDGLLAIPDSAVNQYKGSLKKDVYAGVSKDTCVTLGGSGTAAKRLADAASIKSVDPAKIAALRKKFQPANSAVPVKDGNICLPASVFASEKLWVSQAELTFSMPKAEAGPLVSSIKKVGVQATRSSLITLVSEAEGVFSKSQEALKMLSAGKDVELYVISTVKAALN